MVTSPPMVPRPDSRRARLHRDGAGHRTIDPQVAGSDRGDAGVGAGPGERGEAGASEGEHARTATVVDRAGKREGVAIVIDGAAGAVDRHVIRDVQAGCRRTQRAAVEGDSAGSKRGVVVNRGSAARENCAAGIAVRAAEGGDAAGGAHNRRASQSADRAAGRSHRAGQRTVRERAARQ